MGKAISLDPPMLAQTEAISHRIRMLARSTIVPLWCTPSSGKLLP